MNWLALSPLQVAGIWTTLAAVALWFYLHHRRPQNRRVSTLRFWTSVQPIAQPRRRRLREPWALLAQVLFLLLIILALANPRWGVNFEGRSVVVVLDTSIWSQARPVGSSSWIDKERTEALRLVDSLPSADRVLLLPAEADAPPLLPFTVDRGALRRAIEQASATSGIADIPRALAIGRAALNGSRRGLLVYVGPGMVDRQQANALDTFRAAMETPANGAGQAQFLVRLVSDDSPVENRGITRLSLRRDAARPDVWHLLTQLKNYGHEKSDVVLKLSVSGQPLGQRAVSLAPGELTNVGNELTWGRGGLLQAEIGPSDVLGADDRATVNLPTFRPVHVALFANASPFATNLLNVLASNPYLQPEIGNSTGVTPDVAIYAGSSLPAQPAYNSILFVSGQPSNPQRTVRLVGWNSQHPATKWVNTHDVSVRNPAQLMVQPGDVVLASAEGTPPTPLILAREQNGHKMLIVGFDPQNSNFVQQSAFPLLMAGGIEWMTHSVDESVDSLSVGETDLPGPVTRIISPSGKDVPFARKGQDVHFLTTETGMYRVVAPSGDTNFAVNTPLLPAERMVVTSSESAAVESEPRQQAPWDFWRWLVLLGAVALWLEWWLYYHGRESKRGIEMQSLSGDGEDPYEEDEFDRTSDPSEVRKTNLVI